MRNIFTVGCVAGLLTFSASLAMAETVDQFVAKSMDGFQPFGQKIGTVAKTPQELLPVNTNMSMENLLIYGDSENRLHRWELSGWLEPDNQIAGTLDVESTGWKDDSVQGERIRIIVVEAKEGGFRLLASGRQFKCWRGENKNKWTAELCS